MASFGGLLLGLRYSTLGENLRHAAQFVLVVLLITSLGASVASCCQGCPKEAAYQKTVPSPSDQCSRHMSHVPVGRRLEPENYRIACYRCLRTSQSPGATVVTSDGTSGLSLADREASVGNALPIADLPRMPESPPPVKSSPKQAVICTFLI